MYPSTAKFSPTPSSPIPAELANTKQSRNQQIFPRSNANHEVETSTNRKQHTSLLTSGAGESTSGRKRGVIWGQGLWRATMAMLFEGGMGRNLVRLICVVWPEPQVTCQRTWGFMSSNLGHALRLRLGFGRFLVFLGTLPFDFGGV